jgi:hypothetical protein
VTVRRPVGFGISAGPKWPTGESAVNDAVFVCQLPLVPLVSRIMQMKFHWPIAFFRWLTRSVKSYRGDFCSQMVATLQEKTSESLPSLPRPSSRQPTTSLDLLNPAAVYLHATGNKRRTQVNRGRPGGNQLNNLCKCPEIFIYRWLLIVFPHFHGCGPPNVSPLMEHNGIDMQSGR